MKKTFKTRRFPRHDGDIKPPVVKCQVSELGEKDGAKVSAVTDAAGPQVIVKGPNIHLLSLPLKNHRAAVALGKKVVKRGTGVYPDWMDLHNGGIETNLFAIFGGDFRNLLER
jgi:hypothetical protein